MKETDTVIAHIRNLLDSGRLVPGDRIPAERKLAETLGISRAHIREAISKLEYFGIVKTRPQSGTYISEKAAKSLDLIIADMLRLQNADFKSLVHVRTLLEIDAARLCASRRNSDDLSAIKTALQDYIDAFDSDLKVDKDLALHRAIAFGSGNSVLASLLLVIAPDVLSYYHKYRVCEVPDDVVIMEHREIVEAIEAGDPGRAQAALEKHFRSITSMADSL